jgi:hypothetical protein
VRSARGAKQSAFSVVGFFPKNCTGCTIPSGQLEFFRRVWIKTACERIFDAYSGRVAKYVTNEFTFDLPDSLHDRMLNIFALSDYGPSEFGVVMARTSAPQGATLPLQVAKLLRELEAQLTRFQMHDRTNRLVGNADAEEIRYSFSKNGHSLVQRQVALLLPDARDRVSMVTITATFNEGSASHWHDDFDALLDSMQISK